MQVALDFSDGMSVFTGETGAGKSLLIDAISLLCGERASAGYVKKGCAKAVIEGVFDIHDDARANALLREQGFDLDGEDLIVSREISAEGKSTIRIAQRTCTAAFLRELMSGTGRHPLAARQPVSAAAALSLVPVGPIRSKRCAAP